MSEPTMRTLSLGAGVQSTTLLLMSLDGTLPKVDCAIFADTGWEPARVYEHLALITDAAAGGGVPVLTVSNGDLRADAIDPAHRYASIPYFVRNPDGSNGMGRRQCTSEYKLTPIRRKVRELLGAKAPDFRRVPKGRIAEQWIGFSADEIGRVSDHDQVSYIRKRYPLLELGFARKACERWLRARGWTSVAKSACVGCFSYETEIITADGSRPIGSLVDPATGTGRATLLIPRRRNGWAAWREVEVRSFGTQQLYRIELVKRRETKTVYATAEHRWKTKHPKTGVWSDFVSTLELTPGDQLPVSRAQNIMASGLHNPAVSPFGIAAGFVFGDGSRTNRRNGPAWADFYANKDEPLMPYFAPLPMREYVGTHGEQFTRAYGVPRSWKDVPSLTEARGYLLGWLAGYFAADGHVSKQGQAVLSSANRSHLVHARDVCNLLGVGSSAIRTKDHPAIGGRMATIHELGIYYRDLPLEFWLMPHHRQRVADRMAAVAERRDDWTVASVQITGRVEEVFCAVVPGEEMFVLADSLATGNCPFHGNRQWRELRDNHPGEWQDAVEFDIQIRKGGARGLPLNGEAFLHASRVPLDQAPIDRVTSAEWKSRQGDLLDVIADEDEEGNPDGCSPYGCRSGSPVTRGAA